jgi:phosphonopyruvate decarboxylase
MPNPNYAMRDYSFGTLDRCDVVPKLLENPQDFLLIAGLAGTAKDIAHLCGPLPNYYTCAGVMGGATMMGLGLALAQPSKRVVVATGDGELLMNLGSLATVGVMRPKNLAILCVDNGHYGETGYQQSHTARGVDLAAIATGAGIPIVRTVSQDDDIPEAASLIRQTDNPCFILLRVKPTDPPKVRRSMDAAWTKHRFRDALLSAAQRS